MSKTGFAGKFRGTTLGAFSPGSCKLTDAPWIFQRQFANIFPSNRSIRTEFSLFIKKGVFQILASASLVSRAGTQRAAQSKSVWTAGNSEKRKLSKQSPGANSTISDVSSQLQVKINRA